MSDNLILRLLADADQRAQNVNEISKSTVRTVYTPQMLLHLENSPLVASQDELETRLPEDDFWRLKVGDLRKGAQFSKNGAKPKTRTKQRRASRSEPKEGRRRQREVKKADSWMIEDEPQGNSALDFELWRARMRIETAKRNGEEITHEMQEEYDVLAVRKKASEEEERLADEARQDMEKAKHDEEKKEIEEDKWAFDFGGSAKPEEPKKAGDSKFSMFFGSEDKKDDSDNTDKDANPSGSRIFSLLSEDTVNKDSVPSPQGKNIMSFFDQLSSNEEKQTEKAIKVTKENDMANLFQLKSKSPMDSPVGSSPVTSTAGEMSKSPLNENTSTSKTPTTLRTESGSSNLVLTSEKTEQPLPKSQQAVGVPSKIQNKNVPAETSQPVQPQYSQSQPPTPNGLSHQHLQPNMHPGMLPPGMFPPGMFPNMIPPPGMAPPPGMQQNRQSMPHQLYGQQSIGPQAQGMPANHPLMMLMNKNKRKSQGPPSSNNATETVSSPSAAKAQTQQVANEHNFPPMGGMGLPPPGMFPPGMFPPGMNPPGMNPMMPVNAQGQGGSSPMSQRAQPGQPAGLHLQQPQPQQPHSQPQQPHGPTIQRQSSGQFPPGSAGNSRPQTPQHFQQHRMNQMPPNFGYGFPPGMMPPPPPPGMLGPNGQMPMPPPGMFSPGGMIPARAPDLVNESRAASMNK
ncbi:hypothetical protein DAMA08_025500 [Martiniozyma asiatica (nom. inval.)]|nr:hypothetical protein DAMA08_025500 [Martiniozyma asiatica]